VLDPLDPGVGLEPGCCEDELPWEELPGDVPLTPCCDELPLVELPDAPVLLRLPPYVELPALIPLCDPLVPGDPTLLELSPPCCIAMVRLSDSTICSSRARRASIDPEPVVLELNVPLLPNAPLLAPSVPLLLDVPKVPEPPTLELWPNPPLDEDVVPDCPSDPGCPMRLDCPGWLAPSAPCRDEELPICPLWPAPVALEVLEVPGDPIDELPLVPLVPVDEPDVLA
jgi:hypothetical protein